MRDRIRPGKDHNDLLNKLRDDGIFGTRQKAMMFAAALGYRLNPDGAVQQLDGFGEGIPMSIFQRAIDTNFIDALAVTFRSELQILSDQRGDERLEIFEFFANEGLNRIAKACYESGQEPLEGILDLIDQYQDTASKHDTLPGLEDSARKLGGLM